MSRTPKGATNQLRVIGGQWRGRKLNFTPAQGLRPTGDRVRETLFNWLAPDIHSARCLDLFAGSGALGLEALSRGASHCDFVDTSAAGLADISRHLQTLDASGGHCHRISAADFLDRNAGLWDIVFIDPPFGLDLVTPAAEKLSKPGLLAPNALVYIETGRDESLPPLPTNWNQYREKSTGQVSYRLFVVAPVENV
ncbi:16S rRNA (guanine(966)-N(2))-methyltransferase RsmD [Halioglobus maricola]|uniref:Ribosomal RNA small subunit methyltransferase D n=1 Tax=Halioglobus maricola TaxID=2601894 RepID=A0A5P9NP63_9GAMM|nr:16S rRNA (guanine(966)-N(2))-methyltransferase RsmD [Halioglobus maricola]QFU77620.1 16S rRNA (guanine(966)-N(2))-methyltransferase RsmD [Halioglobus maricola]